MGLGEAVNAAIPRSHIPSPKSNFLEIKWINTNEVILGITPGATKKFGFPKKMLYNPDASATWLKTQIKKGES